ncbi:MAG: hypothetical protein ABT940_06715 [Alphaproteobacteria bacterium]
MANVRLDLRSVAAAVAASGLAVGVALAIRFLLIEPQALGETCQTFPSLWWCRVRLGFVVLFGAEAFGIAGLALAVLSFGAGRPRVAKGLALVAMMMGAIGLVQYNTSLAAPGLLLAWVRMARLGLVQKK